jgi:predicted transcriptional regulator
MKSRSSVLNKILESRYGLTIDRTIPCADLYEIITIYESKLKELEKTLGLQAVHDPEFGRVHLILETARMVLKEIAPRRRKQKGK